jgi:hypothetical protein
MRKRINGHQELMRIGALAAVQEIGWYLIRKVCDRLVLGVGSS